MIGTEKEEEERTPTLEYDDIVVLVHDSGDTYGRAYPYDRAYLLGISMTKGTGMVEHCEALLSLEDVSHLLNIIAPCTF